MFTLTDKKNLSAPNELGYQFGINTSLTEYAHREQNNWGNVLPPVKITVLEVWKNDVFETFLLVDEKTNKELEEHSDFESAAVAIDKYKLLEKSIKLD